jgi:hypothetical protein
MLPESGFGRNSRPFAAASKKHHKGNQTPRIVISIPAATLSELAESNDAFNLGGNLQLLSFLRSAQGSGDDTLV